jgi:hypothetical protein
MKHIIELEGKPGKGEQSHHHHQHLDNLKIKITYFVGVNIMVFRLAPTFFLLFIRTLSRSIMAAPGGRALHSVTAILQLEALVHSCPKHLISSQILREFCSKIIISRNIEGGNKYIHILLGYYMEQICEGKED